MAYNLRLRELRERRGLSQRQVAERLNVSPGAVARWDLGDNKPTMDNLLALAALLECSTDTLLSRDSPRRRADGQDGVKGGAETPPLVL